jgi:hypothetical protein
MVARRLLALENWGSHHPTSASQVVRRTKIARIKDKVSECTPPDIPELSHR